MRETKIVALIAALLLLGSLRAHSEDCDTLRNATPDVLVSYLETIAPDQENAECVTFAINKLGNQRYEPAISALTRLLDFRRPLNPREKQGLYLRIQIIEEIYPAANALELIGRKALPAVLELIKAESTSDKVRENAVAVWMEIYKDGAPQGVALLKQEVDKTNDTAAKQNLKWALSKAVTRCNPPDEAQCKAAAKTGGKHGDRRDVPQFLRLGNKGEGGRAHPLSRGLPT